MATNSIGSYSFPPADRIENYGGDINLYCCWEHHLLVPCPAAYRLPPDITLRDFLDADVPARITTITPSTQKSTT